MFEDNDENQEPLNLQIPEVKEGNILFNFR